VLEPINSSSAATESLEPEPSAPTGYGRNAASTFTGAEKVSVQHTHLKPADPCPERHEGRVYRQKEPKTLIRIVGQAPVKATVFKMERLRCLCLMKHRQRSAASGTMPHLAVTINAPLLLMQPLAA
jgi:hypothetical protein